MASASRQMAKQLRTMDDLLLAVTQLHEKVDMLLTAAGYVQNAEAGDNPATAETVSSDNPAAAETMSSDDGSQDKPADELPKQDTDPVPPVKTGRKK